MWAVDYERDKDFRPYFEEPWQDLKLFDQFWKGCFKRGTEWGHDKAASTQAHIDAKAFLQRVLDK